jgi:hypothetical protein
MRRRSWTLAFRTDIYLPACKIGNVCLDLEVNPLWSREVKEVVDGLYLEDQSTAGLLSCQMSQVRRPRFNKRAPFSHSSALT